MKKSTKGFIYILIGVTLYATLSIFTKILYKIGLPETSLTPLIPLIGFLASLIYNKLIVKKNCKIRKEKYINILFHGLISIGLFNICFFKSLEYLDASITIMILYCNCIFVFLYQTLIKKNKISKVSIISMITVIIGLVLSSGLIGIENMTINKIGLLYAIGSSICYAFFSINVEENLSEIDPTVTVMYALGIGFVFLILVYTPTVVFSFSASITNVTILVLAAILTGLMPLILFYYGINYLGAYKASIIGTLELPITGVLAFLLLSEPLTPIRIISMILIMAGSISIQKNK